jgi:uncharacterized protein YndB with AHSA1/START domain
MKNRTTVERKSERELVVTRTFNGPARLVFEAWTKPELLKRWWVPKSAAMSLLSCEVDAEGGPVTTVTFEEQGGKTLLVVHELYPSKEALDAARASGAEAGTCETYEQLGELLVTLGASERQV